MIATLLGSAYLVHLILGRLERFRYQQKRTLNCKISVACSYLLLTLEIIFTLDYSRLIFAGLEAHSHYK